MRIITEKICAFVQVQNACYILNSFRRKLYNKFQIESNIIRSRLEYFHKSIHLMRTKDADDYVDWVVQCRMTRIHHRQTRSYIQMEYDEMKRIFRKCQTNQRNERQVKKNP